MMSFRAGSLAILFAAGVLSSCEPGPGDGRRAETEASQGRRSMGMQRMMQMMGNMPDGIMASELPDPGSPGAGLVSRYCSQCHGIPPPRRFSAEEWTSTLRRMIVRMERMERMRMGPIQAPSPAEAETILRYFQGHALRTTTAASLAADDPAARLFIRACSRCHALPDPTQYEPEEWPAVVTRMQENMREAEVEELTDQQARQIIAFLRQRSIEAEVP